MSKADDIFYREFGIVLGLLFLFAVFCFFTARVIGANLFEKMQSSPQAVLERVQPVGSARVGTSGETAAAQSGETTTAAAAPAPAPAASAPAAAAGSGKSGEQVYNTACVACHQAGVAGAPKTGDKAAWEPRVSQGLATLVEHAVKGKGAMPPKGGMTNLSDEEVKAAVEYMLEKTGVSAS